MAADREVLDLLDSVSERMPVVEELPGIRLKEVLGDETCAFTAIERMMASGSHHSCFGSQKR